MLSFDEVFKYAKVIILSRKDLSEIENNSFILKKKYSIYSKFHKTSIKLKYVKRSFI